jgi:hypothetical protein
MRTMPGFVPVLGRGEPKRIDLFENKVCEVSEIDGIPTLAVVSNWSRSVEKLAKRFRIRGLNLNVDYKSEDASLDFLDGFPDLVDLSITGAWSIHWNRVESIRKLETLYLHCFTSAEDPHRIDFTRLENLTSCHLTWKSSWESVLQAKTLRSLAISEARALSELNCRPLESLTELRLLGCPALETISLADHTRLRALEINGSRKLNPDWERWGRDLEYLRIVGKVAFPLDELRRAKKLRRLSLFDAGRLPSAQFLRELPTLENLAVDPGVKMSNADRALVYGIRKSLENGLGL